MSERADVAATRPPVEPPVPPGQMRRAIVGASAGNFLEQYDFGLYGTMSAIILGSLYFADAGSSAALFAGLTTYAIGFAARPFGAIVAGHFGDIYGRKIVLTVMLISAGLITAAIGLLPTYASIGIWAPVLLVSLRFLQGFSVGGEMVGAALMVSETAPTATRGFLTSIVPASSSLGFVAANLVILICISAVPDGAFREWAWRVPFLFSFVLVLVGVWVRSRMSETRAFTANLEHEAGNLDDTTATTEQLQDMSPLQKVLNGPFVSVVRSHPGRLMLMIFVCMGFGAANYVAVTYVVGYMGVRGLDLKVGIAGVAIAQTVYALSNLVCGFLSDRLGRRTLITTGCLGYVLMAFPLFAMVNTNNMVLIWIAISLCTAFSGAMFSPMTSLVVESFKTSQRYSGGSAAYQIGLTVGGGCAPLLAASLYARAGATWPVSVLMICAALLTAVSIHFVKETAQVELPS